LIYLEGEFMNKIELIQLKKRLSLIKQGVNDEIMLLEILKVFPVPLDTSPEQYLK